MTHKYSCLRLYTVQSYLRPCWICLLPDGDSLFCHDRVKHDGMLGSGLAKIIQHHYPLHLALGVVFTGKLIESKTSLQTRRVSSMSNSDLYCKLTDAEWRIKSVGLRVKNEVWGYLFKSEEWRVGGQGGGGWYHTFVYHHHHLFPKQTDYKLHKQVRNRKITICKTQESGSHGSVLVVTEL